jgi:hypothetical protein
MTIAFAMRSRRKSRRDSIVSCGFEYCLACPASPLAEGERIEVRGEHPQRQSASNYSSPSPSPKPTPWPSLALTRPSLPKGEKRGGRPKSANQRTLPRRGSQIRFVLPWRAKEGQHALASSSLGASRELHLTLFPQGPIATRARRLSEHRRNVGRYPTFLLTERWNCWHARTRVKCVRRLNQRELHLTFFPPGQPRPGLASQKLQSNYENKKQD